MTLLSRPESDENKNQNRPSVPAIVISRQHVRGVAVGAVENGGNCGFLQLSPFSTTLETCVSQARINGGRGLIAQTLMRSFLVVEGKIPFQTDDECRNCLIAIQIDLFILDTAPKTLNKNVVQGTAASVHTDLDFRLL